MWKWIISVALISFVINWLDVTSVYLRFFEKGGEKYGLVVGILSSRSNFAQREAVRKTWLSVLHDSSISGDFRVKAWFVLGHRDCSVPPQYRLDDYDCRTWQTNASDVEEFSTGRIKGPSSCPSPEECHIHQGFSFRVNHPVVVKRLGLRADALLPKSSVRVTLLNGPLKEVVIESVIDSEGFNTEVDGFLYRSVTPYLLPKRFEGVLLVEGELSRSVSSSVQWDDGNGLITFQRIYKSAVDSDSVEFDHGYHAASGIIFAISDKSNFIDLAINREKAIAEWQTWLNTVDLTVKREMEKWNDIFLVDVVDVYRNLPVKLLKFLHGMSSKYEFSSFLKTDDDCIIHLPQVIKILSDGKRKVGGNWLWSRFRRNWVVNYFGKWKDFNYASVVYPAFPCGGGYVLSSDVATWIASNQHSLYPYQGEDVSVGIWLSAIRPEKYEDDRWNCQEGCEKNSLNRVQLSVEDMYQIWNNFTLCGNICGC